ncbi:MAG: DEAD/DEAH box helicase [Gammaproteobacteria bacterium]|nr:MAG: DEAD/DEAH box helicase [Gammaproteobacteria bacterium]
MSFSQMNLNPLISKAIAVCGYDKPTPVQARCIPDILEGKDLIASARTGTGKTAAFVLPALQRLSAKKPLSKPRILILTPTRELASQICKAAANYGKFLRFNIVNIVGGMSYRQQIKELPRADIIVATPGRLLDHMDNGRVDLSGIEMLIFDEADRMFDMGFIEDVQVIAKQTPKHRQTLLFSATMDEKLSQIVRHMLNNPVRIDLSAEKIAPTQIEQRIYMADHSQHKKRLFHHYMKTENIFKAIIFSATKMNADKLAYELCDMGYRAAALHGDLKQSQRNRTVDQLRHGKIQFLVATDVAARGIDIADLTHVINYDLPRFCEDYVHRIGRTGRAGKSGVAISFALPADLRHLQRIERYTNQKLQREMIAGLEPSAKQASSDGAPAAKKKHRKSGYSQASGKPAKRFKPQGNKENKRSYSRRDSRKDSRRE